MTRGFRDEHDDDEPVTLSDVRAIRATDHRVIFFHAWSIVVDGVVIASHMRGA